MTKALGSSSSELGAQLLEALFPKPSDDEDDEERHLRRVAVRFIAEWMRRSLGRG